tara:strand:- start:1401 stop:1511 length:111 start_codon:yes stop_codon:yes gene_type:complete
MGTLQIDGVKNEKVCAGDILGALTKDGGCPVAILVR